MLIRVKSKHIKMGKRRSATMDPIALAMREAGFVNVTVSCDSINCCTKDFKEKDYNLPDIIIQWIKDWDEKKNVRVIEFTVPDSP